MKKRILCMILAFAILFSIACTSVYAEGIETGEPVQTGFEATEAVTQEPGPETGIVPEPPQEEPAIPQENIGFEAASVPEVETVSDTVEPSADNSGEAAVQLSAESEIVPNADSDSNSDQSTIIKQGFSEEQFPGVLETVPGSDPEVSSEQSSSDASEQEFTSESGNEAEQSFAEVEAAPVNDENSSEEPVIPEETVSSEDQVEAQESATLKQAVEAYQSGTGASSYVITGDEAALEDLTIPLGFEVILTESGTLTIGANAVLTVEGTLFVPEESNASIQNNGTIIVAENGSCSFPENHLYGNMPEYELTVTDNASKQAAFSNGLFFYSLEELEALCANTYSETVSASFSGDIGAVLTLERDLTIPKNLEVTMASTVVSTDGTSTDMAYGLNVPSGRTLTINGSLTVSRLTVNGTIRGYGTKDSNGYYSGRQTLSVADSLTIGGRIYLDGLMSITTGSWDPSFFNQISLGEGSALNISPTQSFTINSSIRISSGTTLSFDSYGGSIVLTVASNATITVETGARLSLQNNSMRVNGSLNNNGSVQIIGDNGNLTVNGSYSGNGRMLVLNLSGTAGFNPDSHIEGLNLNNFTRSDYDTYWIYVQKTSTELAAPVLSGVSLVNGGVKVAWKASDGAVKYRVFRKTGSGGWTKLADTTATAYTDTTAQSGTTYSYTVRCITSDGKNYTSEYDKTGKTVTYIAAPVLSGVSLVNGGVKVAWKASDGAAKYRVFRKTGTGGWTKIADTTSTTYTDKTAQSGTTYSYTVRCISSDGKSFTSAYNTTGKSITYIAAPVLSGASLVNGGVKITWKASGGAAKYRVFRKTGSGGWTKLADTTSTTYTDKTAKSGTAYSYTVRCVSSDGKSFTSAYDTTGKKITYIAAPVLSGVSLVNGGVKITWQASGGAAKYRVFRKTGSSGWTKLADTTSTTYTDKTAKSGTAYVYTVRCISSDGKAYTSAYDTAGKSITYIAAPVLSGVTLVSGGVKITWQASDGAAKYRVFRKTGSSGWTKLADTTATAYTDKTAQSGTTYSYTVRCISSDGKSFTSAYNTKGLSVAVK